MSCRTAFSRVPDSLRPFNRYPRAPIGRASLQFSPDSLPIGAADSRGNDRLVRPSLVPVPGYKSLNRPPGFHSASGRVGLASRAATGGRYLLCSPSTSRSRLWDSG